VRSDPVRSDPMRCDRVADALPAVLDGSSPVERRVVAHVETCLRCQAELARYRRMLRLLHQLRAQRPTPPAGAVSGVLAALEERAGKGLVRSTLTGRRVAVVGGVVVCVSVAAAMTALSLGRNRAKGAARASS
jgi:anti-sigma factor RsiW